MKDEWHDWNTHELITSLEEQRVNDLINYGATVEDILAEEQMRRIEQDIDWTTFKEQVDAYIINIEQRK